MAGDAPKRSWAAGITPQLLFLVIAAALGPLQFGYHLAELNAPEKALRCLSISPKPRSLSSQSSDLPSCIPMTSVEFGTVSSIYTLGGLIGALSAGPISSKRGRLSPMRLSAPFHIFGSLMEAFAPNIPVIVVGRFLSGIASGASLVVGPIYISEISPSDARGALGAMTQIFTNLGILFTQVLGYFLSYDSMWRVVLGTASLLGVLQFISVMLSIESPEWLGTNGRPLDAAKNMRKIRGGFLDEDEAQKWGAAEDSESEQQSLLGEENVSRPQGAHHGTSATSIGFFEVVRHPDNWKAIVAVISVMLAQQLCGINSVIMYSVSFLSELLPTEAGLITVAVGALNFVVTIACSPLSDRLGRKTCLLLSIAGMGINSFILALSLMYKIKILTGIVTLLFVASFAVGLGPVPFILASELVGPEAVGATQSWALGANWIATFLVAQFFPILSKALSGGRVFFVFTGLAAVFFMFISWWVPESREKQNADDVWGREQRSRRQD
ncbi:hypothetical protein MMC10_000381 [Thelotrema lepadinum]|nr:hypothetical protein [Thelotrema lepadinum]